MDLPIEIWHNIFNYINLSDAYQLLSVSRYIYDAVKKYTGPLSVDVATPLKIRNMNIFILQWLNAQTRLDLSFVDLAPHELVRIIDQFPNIDIIIMKSLVDETVFFELLILYAKLDPTHYEHRKVRIELGNNNKVRQIRDARIKEFNEIIPNGDIYRYCCPLRTNKILPGKAHQCHECFKDMQAYEYRLCIKCKSKCCNNCVYNYKDNMVPKGSSSIAVINSICEGCL
jgi:hypothetical protein